MTTIQLKGVDGLAVRLGLALAKWGQVRAERAAVDHEQAATRLRIDNTVAERERNSHRYGIAS
jgi:hypothetical protein